MGNRSQHGNNDLNTGKENVRAMGKVCEKRVSHEEEKKNDGGKEEEMGKKKHYRGTPGKKST